MFKNIVKLCRKSLNYHSSQKHISNLRTLSTRDIQSEERSSFNDVPVEEQNKKHVNPFAAKKPIFDSQNYKTEGNNDECLLSLEDKDRRLKVLQLEVDIASQEGRRVPALDFFNDHHWEHVLSLPTKSARMKYYNFLWQVEMKKLARKRKQEERAATAAERIESIREERAQNNHIIYGLGHVSMFLRIYDTAINQWMNHRYCVLFFFCTNILEN